MSMKQISDSLQISSLPIYPGVTETLLKVSNHLSTHHAVTKTYYGAKINKAAAGYYIIASSSLVTTEP